jgi:carboxyl-terminal processing protease
LDVRNNGGGFLDAAVEVSGLWLENGTLVVEQRADDTVIESLKKKGNGPLIGFETILLINKGSASASEIVAGALQDYNVATLVGETSFGKGSVQSLDELDDGGVLKVTIARWYTPDGSNIDHEGIEPDVTIEFTDEDYENDNDPQLDEAVKLLNQ